MKELMDRLYSLFRPVVETYGLTLVDVEWASERGGVRLGVYITRTVGGVSLDDCETVARALDELLEATPELSNSYTLEVASPGLDRVLKRTEEYDIFRGHSVSIRVRAPYEGKYELEGELKGLVGDQLELETPSGTVSIPFSSIKKTKLLFKMK
ncbi:MAG: ribosome maturation factor RimP [Peptococcaceae bacterium]|nr:ribosome maturation factor RimP [Peptococcaceae bacterium]